MTPPKPANDERPPLWPGLSRRAEERIGFWFSVIGIAALIGFAVAVLDAGHWLTIAVIVISGFVVMLIAGLWRALIGGQS